MKIAHEYWEHGSEFHWLDLGESSSEPGVHPWSDSGVFFGSGRDAIRALLRHGSTTLGWKKVLVPSFLCQEVVGAISDEGLVVGTFFDDPRESIQAPIPKREEVVLVVNTFGLRSRWVCPGPRLGFVIEDHTHDPWSSWAKESQADFCIASLRKTLPIPDGAVLWSPTQLPLPNSPELTLEHEMAMARKLEAMIIKTLFLRGYGVDKEAFRSQFAVGEAAIAMRKISTISPVSEAIINCFDVVAWRTQRFANYRVLAKRLSGHQGLSVLATTGRDSCPFSVILLCSDNFQREQLRRCLIKQQIYATVLWPLENRVLDLPKESIELSRCALSLHCDGRYSKEDMMEVAYAVEAILSRKKASLFNND